MIGTIMGIKCATSDEKKEKKSSKNTIKKG